MPEVASALLSRLLKAAALVALSAAPAAAEQLPNVFESSPVGQASMYETERGHRLYVYAGRVDGGFLEQVYEGCPPDGAADVADLGAPIAQHWYDGQGELLRSRWGGDYVAEYAPHGCLVTLGACGGEVRYRGWLADPQALEVYQFENSAQRSDDRVDYTYREYESGEDQNVEVTKTVGWYELRAGGGYGDGASLSTRRGEQPSRRWHRRIAGPTTIADICAGVS